MSDNRYDAQNAEKKAQQLWQEQKIYEQIDVTKPLFSIDTPPPTVSGALHVGHVFSYTHTDIIARYKRLSGFSVFYPFGLDDNGLPTERFVEQKHNIQSHTMKRSEFINYCLQESELMGKAFCAVMQRLGLSADFESAYSTISKKTQAQSQRSFIELYKKGFIYRKSDPAIYCTTCQTTVAQAELDDAEKASTFYTIIFDTSHGQKLHIATTRPELLPSCVALVFHPDDTRYQSLINTKVKVPLYNHEVSIVSDERVERQKGTGLVMVCTFGDKTDILWFRILNLPYRPSIGSDGRFLNHTGPLSGLTVFSARKKIIEMLSHEQRIVDQKDISHTVSLHERCKKEIEFLILPQWFIAILPHKQALLDIANKINWYPEFMKSRYLDWVRNLSWDWCISRQRTYGIPFPAFHCLDCNAVLLPTDDQQLPIDPQEQQFVKSCTSCKSSNIIPDTDVMDTWNTSSLTPYLCKTVFEEKYGKTEQFLPMSMRPQAHDIIRTWAFDTIVKTLFHNDITPWNDIVISGHVLSKEKKKLSKKEGAALVPEILLEQYPADAIRYWTASSRLGQDIVYSEGELKNGARLITKLWNAFKFLAPHIHKKPTHEKSPHDLLNKWILSSLTSVFQEYNRYFAVYEFGLALQTVEQFFWSDFCDNYVECVKHRLYNKEEYDQALILETETTISSVGISLLQLFAPFLPHITEHLYQELYQSTLKTGSIHQTNFSEYQPQYVDPHVSKPMAQFLHIIKEARRLKTEHQLSLKTEIADLLLVVQTNEEKEHIEQLYVLLRHCIQANTIRVERHIVKNRASFLTNGNNLWSMHIVLE